MINVQGIDDLAQRLSALIPPGMSEAQRDIAQNMRAVLRSGLERMDLVTREEFDVQRCVLLRTREKVETLERQVQALEAAVAAMRRRDGQDAAR